jgi:hypothetical protein
MFNVWIWANTFIGSHMMMACILSRKRSLFENSVFDPQLSSIKNENLHQHHGMKCKLKNAPKATHPNINGVKNPHTG